MIPEQRLRSLEAKFSLLAAVVDGSEEQTRQATVYLVGLVPKFLHEKGLIDEEALRNYVKSFEGDASDREDYMGDLVRRFESMIAFHESHPRQFDLAGGA